MPGHEKVLETLIYPTTILIDVQTACPWISHPTKPKNYICCCCLVTQSYLTLCDPMNSKINIYIYREREVNIKMIMKKQEKMKKKVILTKYTSTQ